MRELAQTFRFGGATSAGLADVLATAALVGDDSIFGNRKVESTSTDGGVRRAVGFEPVPIPLLRFDVTFRQESVDGSPAVVVEFAQPARRRPYLAGEFVWFLDDEAGPTAVLREEINTPAALDIVGRPLDGTRPSFRRWLFFAGGHERLMADVAANLATLLEDRLAPS